jgi:hypothetical protein
VHHPELRSAYGDFFDDVKIDVTIDRQMKGRGHGQYDSDTKRISVVAPNAEEARRIMLHEANHAVSRLEGRATGGSPRKAGGMIEYALNRDPNTPPELREKLGRFVNENGFVDDHRAYESLQDEVLSRGVETRRDMAPNVRADTPPEWDVQEPDWIVSRDNSPNISMADGGSKLGPVSDAGKAAAADMPPFEEQMRMARAVNEQTIAARAARAPAPSSNLPAQAPAKTGKSAATVNIGLKIGETGRLDPQEAIAALEELGIAINEQGILQSATEDTLVAGLSRPLTADEATALSARLQQDAIAQKVGKSGELYGPKAAEWGPFNDDFFLQLKQLRSASKKGQADPPIFDYSLLERDPGHRYEVPLYDPPRGTPEREARLLRNKGAFGKLVEFARKGMNNDGLGWYNTEELRREFHNEWGPEEGQRAYEQFIDLIGATSAGAKTDANVKIASWYFARNRQGLPTEIPKKGSGYGHKVQNAHYDAAKNIFEGVPLDPFEHPKRSRFAANLKGDWRHSTIDKHNVRALAIASRDKEWISTSITDDVVKPSWWKTKQHGEWDPKTFNPREFAVRTRMPFDKIPVAWFEDAPKGTAYKALSQLNERLAAELGVTPAQAQAALWLGAGDATGLGSKPIALMKVIDQRLAITARGRKITKKEALRQMVRGENPLLQLGGATVGTGALLPLLGDDEGT